MTLKDSFPCRKSRLTMVFMLLLQSIIAQNGFDKAGQWFV